MSGNFGNTCKRVWYSLSYGTQTFLQGVLLPGYYIPAIITGLADTALTYFFQGSIFAEGADLESATFPGRPGESIQTLTSYSAIASASQILSPPQKVIPAVIKDTDGSEDRATLLIKFSKPQRCSYFSQGLVVFCNGGNAVVTRVFAMRVFTDLARDIGLFETPELTFWLISMGVSLLAGFKIICVDGSAASREIAIKLEEDQAAKPITTRLLGKLKPVENFLAIVMVIEKTLIEDNIVGAFYGFRRHISDAFLTNATIVMAILEFFAMLIFFGLNYLFDGS